MLFLLCFCLAFYAHMSSQSEAHLVSFTEVEHTAERERLKTETKNRKRPSGKSCGSSVNFICNRKNNTVS